MDSNAAVVAVAVVPSAADRCPAVVVAIVAMLVDSASHAAIVLH